MAAKVIDEVLERAFGKVTSAELRQFFELFSRLLDHLNENQQEMAKVFQANDVAFFLVTTAREDAINEAQHFAQEIKTRNLKLGGFLLNRYPIKLDKHIDLHELYQAFDQVLNEAEQSINVSNGTKESLKELFQENLISTQSSHILRLNTEHTLSSLGNVYRLKELQGDASTLEGIAQLTEQLMGLKPASQES